MFGLCGLMLLSIFGCKEDSSEDDVAGSFNTTELLTNYSSHLIIPKYAELVDKMEWLKTTTAVFVAIPNTDNLVAVQLAVFEAEFAYQACTSFEFGPANTYTLRSILSTYPSSESIIDQNITNGNYNLYAAGNIAAIGFPAMEYLLFGNQKTAQEIVDMYSTDLEAINRINYLSALVDQSYSVVSQVVEMWVYDGYKEVFVNANGTAVGSSVSLMLNAMVLDFERFIRDGKVGIPVGVRSLGVANPEKVEAFYSQKSLGLLKESVLEYKNSFNGISTTESNGVGFDDYLNYEDAESISQNINIQLDIITEKLNLLNGPLSEEVVTNSEAVNEVYDEMQKLIVSLKVEVPSALSVLITYQDSDGD